MALLLGVNPPDQEPSFGGRGIMRSSGIRRPWMPAPLADLTTGVVRGAAIVTMAAAMALPGASVWMPRPLDAGAPPPPELRVLPPTVLVNQPQQPIALTYRLLAPRDQIAPPPERLSPPQLVSGQQPQPIASFWMPTPARTPNTDPLRPLTVALDAPDSTLAQPSTNWLGRLSRVEDVQWPPRPAIVRGVPVPIPGASVWMSTPARVANVDPLRPPRIVAQPPDPTLAQPAAHAVGRLSRAEDVQWPARPIMSQTGAQPVPGAITAQLTRPRDQVVIAPERLALTTAITPVFQPPPAIVRTVGAVARDTPVVLEPRAVQPGVVITPARAQPGALAVWTRGGIDGTAPPIPPIEGPYQGDAYIYDVDGSVGTVSGGTILPNGGQTSPVGGVAGGTVQAGPNQDSPIGTIDGGTVQPGPQQASATGSVSGGTVQPGPNQSSATGSLDGGTVLPPETIL